MSRDDAPMFLSEDLYRHMEEMSIRKAVADYYHPLIYCTPIRDWPVELKRLGMALTGKLKLITKEKG